MSVLKERKKLEREYTNICLHNKISLPSKNNRLMSVSPTSFYYHTDVNPMVGDVPYFQELNRTSHYGLRAKLEREALEILQDCFEGHFFQIKDKVLNLSFDELNRKFQKNKKSTIKVDKYNRLLKLFRRWSEESKECHYKLNNAQKRLSKKYK